ncbi:MAG: signal peptidase II [Lachnospiraceae bacterium]
MEKEKKQYLPYLYGILGVAVFVLLDQYTKHLAVLHLKDQSPFVIIENVFQLQYLENRGAAFGLLQNQQVFFLVSGILILGAVVFCYIRVPKTPHFRLLRICMILICSGAIGNMIDRIGQNYVVDFFYFELINFPVFNVADICVTLSIGILFLSMIYYKEDDFNFLSMKREK